MSSAWHVTSLAKASAIWMPVLLQDHASESRAIGILVGLKLKEPRGSGE